ncbi:MAG: 4-hydroxy-tetrahydrodipicolinate synthase [Planctomycetes bacterium]|nr:4-hydroxy-tetrahydrodipicolinate synthase [Planctomycetota bacterium]
MSAFRGTITALITPFSNGKLDEARLEALVERQIAAGVDGLVPCGTTGESPTLSHEEAERVIACVVRTARKRVPVIAGTGSYSTAEAIRKSHKAGELGADGLLIVSPYYNKPTQAGLFAHFSAIARETKLPIMLYNIPGRCGVEISVPTIARLHQECPNIVSVKHATGRVDDAADLMAASKIEVISGDDPITWPLMALGAVGVVSVMSNLCPKATARITTAALAGDVAAARAAHQALYPLMRGLLSLETNPIPIKTAMAMKGFCAEEFRLPMCPLAPENRKKLEALLEKHPLD